MSAPVITIAPAEPRQVARVLPFDATLAAYINWDHIAQTARELGAHFEARTAADGAITVTIFWAYDAGELEAVGGPAVLEALTVDAAARAAKGGAR